MGLFEQFPYTNFHEMNLDWFMNTFKDLLKEWEDQKTAFADIKTAFQALHDYVDNYFDNLDVQQEINDKLDAMADSGELAELLAPYFTIFETNYTARLDALSSRMDTFTQLGEGSTTGDAELADIRVSAYGETYPTAGDAVRGQVEILQNQVSQYQEILPISRIRSTDIESGYYSSVDGKKQNSDSFVRTKYLYRIDGGCFYYTLTGAQVRMCLYDAAMNFISHIYISSHEPADIEIVPQNAVYCGMFISSSASPNNVIGVVKHDSTGVEVAEYPFNDMRYSYKAGYWCDGTGTVQAAANLSMVTLYNPKAGDRYYVSNNASFNGVCKDASGNVLTAVYETVDPYGRIVTVPDNAVIMYFNLYNADTQGVTANPANYVAKLTKNKKVLCIGDSVTWLDGRGVYGGAQHLNGYQAALRKAGYDVRTAGYSGYPYTQGINGVYSIYNEIVNNSYAVAGYDYIILMGGLNDMLYNAPIGTRPSAYDNRSFDSYTFNGALGGIISYIREHNHNAKIILCTPTKSEAVTRIWTAAERFNDEIRYNSMFWSCYLCDLATNLNVQPTYDQFDDYFYDPTHPNYNGMLRIGKQTTEAVETA